MSSQVGTKDGVATFYAETRESWREWLEHNGPSEKSVWLIIYHKKSPVPSVSFHDAIVDALCFGWVDSRAAPRDHESFFLMFSPRNPKSTWGRVNRERAEEMIRQGLMRPPGQAAIDVAKATNNWDSLADAQNGVIPDDLQQLFDDNETAFRNFQAFPMSSRRLILEWIEKAKKPETRQRRMTQTVDLAAHNIRANHPRPAKKK